MVVFSALLLGVIVLLLGRCKFVGIYPIQFMDRNNTDVIRGAAILIILLHHAYTVTPELPKIFAVFGPLGAFGTALFFFFSGYGNQISLRKPGGGIRWLFRREFRLIFSFFVIFAIYAVLLNVVGLIGTNGYRISDLVMGAFTLTLPPWSNWFLKVQVGLYIFHFVLDRFLPEKYVVRALSFGLLLYTVGMIIAGASDYWWTSAICYAMGAISSNISIKLYRSKMMLTITMVLAVTSYVASFLLEANVIPYAVLVLCITGTFFVAMLTQYFKLSSVIMKKVGSFSYELYLSQAIFMNLILLQQQWATDIRIAVYGIASLLLAVVVCFVYNVVAKRERQESRIGSCAEKTHGCGHEGR